MRGIGPGGDRDIDRLRLKCRAALEIATTLWVAVREDVSIAANFKCAHQIGDRCRQLGDAVGRCLAHELLRAHQALQVGIELPDIQLLVVIVPVRHDPFEDCGHARPECAGQVHGRAFPRHPLAVPPQISGRAFVKIGRERLLIFGHRSTPQHLYCGQYPTIVLQFAAGHE